MGVYAQKIYKLSGLLIHMPSKYAGEELRAIIKKVRDGTFEYKNRDKSEINWRNMIMLRSRRWQTI